MKSNENGAYVLGLDIGSNSIGWALLSHDGKKSCGLEKAGVRVFEAGVEGDIKSGRDQSRGVNRREARLRRRMLARHNQRLRTLTGLLQKAGLLPAGDLSTDEARHKYFGDLDNAIFPESTRKEHPQTFHYQLRAQALDRQLSPFELGRTIYHLAQRRGFLSNRKAGKSADKDEGPIKEEIGHLSEAIKSSGARTLGEFFSKTDPEKERIRQRHTSRQMYLYEFEKIWTFQERHHPAILTDKFKKMVHKAIFFQRPLKSVKRFIGECELEPGRKRAPLAVLPAQRFRLLQKVNDLTFKGVNPATGAVANERSLTNEERAKLVAVLETEGDRTFAQIRKLLGFPKWMTFNFMEGGEKKLLGNRTAAAFREIFGEPWDKFASEEKDRIVDEVRSMQKPDAQYRRGMKAWGLEGEAADNFGDLVLEPDYCSLSRQALAKVLPLLEEGIPYATARKKIYGDRPAPKPIDELPPLDRAEVPEIRNPAVSRTLTEVRKVVNAIIRKYGKPAQIRIELARDLKKNRQDRKAIWKRNLENRDKREEAGCKLLAEAGIDRPSRTDVEKWLLYEECMHLCPYTGKPISVASLFGSNPQFDIEHIIPFHRSLDNTFLNKTLCHVAENRNVKRNRTPWEAYGSNQEKWGEIIQRATSFKGDAALAKLERFQLKDMESFDDFTERQLADTRYASRQAIQYLGLLYGTGAQGVDADHTRRIQAGRGGVTRYLRDEYGLNRILSDGGIKNREDHRNHAVDAICIALTDSKIVHMLSDAAARAWQERRRRFGLLAPPWPSFYNDTAAAIEKLLVSHRVSRKVSGPLHDETIYSKRHTDADGRTCVHIRKRIEGLSRSDIEAIVDPIVKQAVIDKLGDGEAKKVFADMACHPVLSSGVPIHTVRIRKYDTTMPIGSGVRRRLVISGSNHHLEIFEIKDKKGKPKWGGRVVATFEAMQRLRNGKPIVCREYDGNGKFVFSLAGREIIELNRNGKKKLYVVRKITTAKQKQSAREYVSIAFVNINDARKKKDIQKAGEWFTGLLEPLREMECRKVVVTPLGEPRLAND